MHPSKFKTLPFIILVKAFLVFTYLIFSLKPLSAQPPPPPDYHGTNTDFDPAGGGAPLDDLLAVWLIMSIIYLGYFYLKKRIKPLRKS